MVLSRNGILKDDLVLEDVPQLPCCITLHPGFQPICLGKMGFKKPREEIQDARSEKI